LQFSFFSRADLARSRVSERDSPFRVSTFIISGRAQKHIDIKITRVIIRSLITPAILFHGGPRAHGVAIALNFSRKSTGSPRKSHVIFPLLPFPPDPVGRDARTKRASGKEEGGRTQDVEIIHVRG